MSEYVPSTTYPNALRVSDPLLIRISELALTVGSLTYSIRIKEGILECGFMVYVNGAGCPIYKYKDEDITKRWARLGTSADSHTPYDELREELFNKAKQWMDSLEETIMLQKSGNVVKEAIDRLCWQLHYDLSESTTDFPTTFPNFSDITIDTPAATVFDVTGEIANLNTSLTGQVGSKTGLGELNTAITNVKTAVDSVKTSLDTIGDKIYKTDADTELSARIKKIADSLRGDNEYTISRALRESGENSVSGATEYQTTVEQQRFTNLDTATTTTNNTLGDHSSGLVKAVDDANRTLGDNNSGLVHAVNTANDTLGDANGGLVKSVGDANESIGDVKTSIGVPLAQDGSSRTAGSGGDTLYEAIYRHPGFLGMAANGYGMALPSGNSSFASSTKEYIMDRIVGDGTVAGYVGRTGNQYYVITN